MAITMSREMSVIPVPSPNMSWARNPNRCTMPRGNGSILVGDEIMGEDKIVDLW